MRERLKFILGGLIGIVSLSSWRGGTARAADTALARKLNREGEALLEKSRYHEAIEVFRRMLQAAKDNPYASAVAVFYLGRCELELAEYDSALRRLDQAEKVFVRLNRENEKAIVVQTKARLFAERSRFKESLLLYESAAEVFERIKNRDALFDLFNSSGAVHAYLGLSDQALECMSLAQRLLSPKPHPRQLALLNNNTGLTSVLKQEYAVAQKSFDDALKQFRKYGDQRGEATVLNNIGYIREAKCEYAKALEAHQASLDIARRISDPRDQALALNNIGNVHLKKGDYEAAWKSYEESIKISDQKGIKQFLAETMNNMGVVGIAYGRLQSAQEKFDASLSLAREVGAQPCEAWALNNMGFLLKDQGKFRNSLKCYNEAIRIAESLGNKRLKSTAVMRRGNLGEYRGRFAEAYRDYQSAAKTQKEIGDLFFYAAAITDGANILTRNGEFERAVKNYEEAVSVRRKIGSPCGEALCNMALHYIERPQYSPKHEGTGIDQASRRGLAARALDEASRGVKPDVIQDFLLLTYVRGKYLVEENIPQAVEAFKILREKAESAGWPKYVFLGNIGSGLCAEKGGEIDKARQYYKAASTHVNSIIAGVGEAEKEQILNGEEILGIKHRLPFERLATLG